MQKIVEEFNKETAKYCGVMPISARLLDIQSETGELVKEYLKSTKYGTCDFSLTEDFKLEFGDVFYSILCLAEEIKIDAKECLNMAIEKYKTRLSNSGGIGSENGE